MDSLIAHGLHTRNRAIIDAVLAKAARCCPDALDLIAITGSFSRDDYYEKSDLDLLIVINDPTGRLLAKCFVLSDVGHDIYCQTREVLEHAAEYPDPHVAKLLDAEVVYCRSKEVAEWYRRLGDELRIRMAAAPDISTLNAIEEHMNAAWQDFGRLCAEQNVGRCRYFAAGVLYRIEYAVYMLNGAYIRRGIRGIPEEICALPTLPEEFALSRADRGANGGGYPSRGQDADLCDRPSDQGNTKAPLSPSAADPRCSSRHTRGNILQLAQQDVPRRGGE